MKAGITLSTTNLPQFDRGVIALLPQQGKTQHQIVNAVGVSLSPLSVQNYSECGLMSPSWLRQYADQKRKHCERKPFGCCSQTIDCESLKFSLVPQKQLLLNLS